MNLSFNEVVISAYLHSLGNIAVISDYNGIQDINLFYKNFFDANKAHFPSDVNVDNLLSLICSYKSKKTLEDRLLFIAANLAAGYSSDVELPVNRKACSMKHILSTLKLEEMPAGKPGYYKLNVLDEDAILSQENSQVTAKDYEKLIDGFCKDFSALKGLDFEKYTEALRTMLEHYFWSVPYIVSDKIDTGFFQHVKNTVAIVSVLYRFAEEQPEIAESNEEKKFYFINGDISGIQKYIFELKQNEFSAKLLRAKSFQLWALSEILSQYIVKEFEVTNANIITSAGGKFILMVPNTASAKEKLEKLQLEIECYFLDNFAGKLAVIISDGVAASQKDFLSENSQVLFNRIGTKGDECKQFKMQKVLRAEGHVLNKIYEKLQLNGECPKCGIFASESSDGTEPCKNCQDLIDIGRDLVKGAVVSLDSSILQEFGKMVKVSRKAESYGYSINHYVPGKPVMFLPYTAPYKDNGKELLTFEEIAEKSKGNKKLAMFKSDIDNLGLVFSSSLGKNISVSSYADLSHMIHYFFSTFFAWFVKNNKDQNGDLYKDKIYTVFSGGDDLCIIGAWDSVIKFSIDFQKKLKKFTNNNPSITVSGGISLASKNTPVAIIASQAEELLDLSKSEPQKNSISLFNTTVSWEDFEKMYSYGRELEELFDRGLSIGPVYKMLEFADRAEQIQKGNIKEILSQSKNALWKSNLIYTVERNVKNEKAKNILLGFGTDPLSMVKSRIAVTYSLYTQRKN